MTTDDIIRLAQEAGWGFSNSRDSDFVKAQLRFAELVAVAEREKVAQWMMQQGYATGHGDTTEELLTELDWQIKERLALGIPYVSGSGKD
jgi:hypothetical protein